MHQDHQIPLRLHHALCLLSYVGKGYSAAYAENMTATAQLLEKGCAARIVRGDDALCQNESIKLVCPQRVAGRCYPIDIIERDTRALADLSRFSGSAEAWQAGNFVIFSASLVQNLREAFAKGAIRSACNGCSWGQFCTDTAKNNFEKTVFFRPQKPLLGRSTDTAKRPLP